MAELAKTVGELVEGQTFIEIFGGMTVFEAAKLMAQSNIGAVPVVDQAGAIIGIFTERDMMARLVAAGLPADDTTVAEVMTPDPKTLSYECGTGEAKAAMTEGGFRHLPVVVGVRPIGMLSLRDLSSV